MFTSFVRSEDPAVYLIGRHGQQMNQDDPNRQDDQTILAALNILSRRLRKASIVMGEPKTVKQYLQLRYTGLAYEVFL